MIARARARDVAFRCSERLASFRQETQGPRLAPEWTQGEDPAGSGADQQPVQVAAAVPLLRGAGVTALKSDELLSVSVQDALSLRLAAVVPVSAGAALPSEQFVVP